MDKTEEKGKDEAPTHGMKQMSSGTSFVEQGADPLGGARGRHTNDSRED